MPPPHQWPYPIKAEDAPPAHVWLRVLATTDLHGNILSCDPDRPDRPLEYGLARVATLIRQARAEAPNTVLLDNGDFLQGSTLGDMAVQPGGGWTGPNPMIAAMNALGYDAGALGNHEFNFGLEALATTLKQAHFPIVCANALTRVDPSDPARDTGFVPHHAMLDVTATDSAGAPCRVSIGLIGLLPPQVTTWDQDRLKGRIVSRGIVETARAHVPRARAQGADLVLALAHTGIGSGSDDPAAEHAALALADVPGIDAIIAGHSHEVFPRPGGTSQIATVDHDAGTFGGRPAVMAGFRGSHLGILDLCLAKDRDGGWQVIAHRAEARPVKPARDAPATPADPAIVRMTQPAQSALMRLTGRVLTRTARPLHSFTALVCCDTLQRLVLSASARALTDALRGTEHQDLPVLAASAPFKTGGHGGPDYFTDLPAGPITPRSVAEFYPFPNTLVGLRVTGADLNMWLERAASGFARLVPGQPDQALWNRAIPGHMFDSIAGLTYKIDLSQPARFDATGQVVDAGAHRITDLRHQGAPVEPDAGFALAVNSFRAFAGGLYPPATEADILFRGDTLVTRIIAHYLEQTGLDDVGLAAAPWSFAPLPGIFACLYTGPGLRRYPLDLERLRAVDLGLDEAGFLHLRLPF